MKSITYIYIFLVIILAISLSSTAQDNTKANCSNLLNSGYVSDGQEYIAKLDENNVAKFYCTFYGNSQYRIIACSDITEAPLVFSVYDTEKNLLFCNKNHQYTPYWNFIFTSTINCIVEIEFDIDKWLKQEVKLLIGFKEN